MLCSAILDKTKSMLDIDSNLAHLLTWTAAAYGVVIYSLAFAFEMFLIVTSSEDTAPIVAFILATLYFVVILASLILMLALIVQSILCLMIWLITFVVTFVPEAGLVLFMSLHNWVSN